MKNIIKQSLLAAALGVAVSFAAQAADLAPLNSDTEPDRVDWSQLQATFGDIPAVKEGLRVGGVSKTLTNEYWRTLGEGAILASPQSDANLQAAFDQAQQKGIPFINVNDAVMPLTEYYVGCVQRDNGVRVAKWFMENTEGGKVAVIEGQPGVYAVKQRTEGFTQTIADDKRFELVASVPANWSREQAYNAATNILQRTPDLLGFYVNNDGMALGVVEAVKAAGLLGKCYVFGTDGISDAYKSIQAGELSGTVDSVPLLTGEVAMEVALRIVGGQDIPRVVATPQALITKDNVAEYSISDSAKLRELLLSK